MRWGVLATGLDEMLLHPRGSSGQCSGSRIVNCGGEKRIEIEVRKSGRVGNSECVEKDGAEEEDRRSEESAWERQHVRREMESS